MRKHKINDLNVCLCAAVCLSLLGSCKDDYIYDDEAPTWLGNNIYEYLEQNGQYTNYLALVKVMKKHCVVRAARLCSLPQTRRLLIISEPMG